MFKVKEQERLVPSPDQPRLVKIGYKFLCQYVITCDLFFPELCLCSSDSYVRAHSCSNGKFRCHSQNYFLKLQQLFFHGFFQEVNKSTESGSRTVFYVFNATIGNPQSFFKLLIGKGPYKQPGPAQIGPIHPPPSFSHHLAITRTITNQ